MIVSRVSFLKPFLFSLLVVASLSSKALHLFQHIHSIQRSLFALYFPTFLIQDVLLFTGVWLLLQITSGYLSALGLLIAGFFAILTLVAASSQIGFFYVTGSEIQWGAAKSFQNDPAGMKLLLSGLQPVVLVGVIITFIAWSVTPHLYNLVGGWLSAILDTTAPEKFCLELPVANMKLPARKTKPIQFWTLCIAVTTLILQFIRPSVPYDHISGTIAFKVLSVFRSQPPRCSHPDGQPFPLPHLLEGQFWEAPDGHYKGWTPGLVYEEDMKTKPEWVPEVLPPGFWRWSDVTKDFTSKNYSTFEVDATNDATKPKTEKACSTGERNVYSPVHDPMRITNLDLGLLEPLEEALKEHPVPITHVVLLTMESARKDVFPFKSGSHLHDMILASHETQDPAIINDINAKLARMTPIAEKLTGESSEFPVMDHGNLTEELWEDTAEPGMGGINVVGALTGSSLSFKSVLTSHCGVGPLAVDFLDEVENDIYQPCIMQILELFNRLKKDSTDVDDVHERRWKSVFVQSITGLFDQQNILNDKMGFSESIYKETIANENARHYHSGMEEINYFGYPETEVLPYIRDAINDAVENDERLFLSHFTSTTHHPWGTPADYAKEQYYADDGIIAKHTDMNNYLNTIRYVDQRIGDILKILDETGIANETLFVAIGDHGQAFREDSRVAGTYENGHISNFRVPLIFRHPLLPRLQVSANATSLSILPTILDLLINTNSLNELDTTVALDLLNEYEGQSLLRPYKASHNGRQAWNMGIINAGGTMLSVGSAAVPFRLILPLKDDFTYVFSNLETDPHELEVIEEWNLKALVDRVRRVHGAQAADWVADADKVGRWWVEERKRLWNYREAP